MYNLPDKETRLLVIGSQRSGMGWLESNIERHPTLQLDGADDKPKVGQILCHVNPNLAITTSEHIAVLRHHLPKARALYVLRNPNDRSLSYLKLQLKNSLEKQSDSRMIETALREPATHSFYTNNIIRWQRVWGESLNILFFDDLVQSPRKFFKEIEAIAGIDKNKSEFKATRKAQRMSEDMALPEEVTNYFSRVYKPELNELRHYVDASYVENWIEGVQ